ncbi:hypothetical protein [Streptomyces sp. NPDC088757]|uniref:hypothetical protein n=1 Tax=Streptomyces sp. NPDC088757 TaxID=3365889 RepID=UPI003828E7FC
MSEKATVTSLVVRRFITRGLSTDLSGNPSGTPHHPGQVAEVRGREDLTKLVAADTPLGPEQAAACLRVRRVEFDRMVEFTWIRAAKCAEMKFGTSRAEAAVVPLYRTADVDALPATHPEADWAELRQAGKGRSRDSPA